MTFIPDASVVAKLYFAEDRSDLAEALVADAGTMDELLIAPYILPAEFVNITRRKMRSEGVELGTATQVVEEFLTLPIEYHAEPEIYLEAIALTERYSLSGFDAQYVALAQLAGCDLWVDDERMMTAIAGRLRFVRRLADYQPRGS